jgi:hypothetical protein
MKEVFLGIYSIHPLILLYIFHCENFTWMMLDIYLEKKVYNIIIFLSLWKYHSSEISTMKKNIIILLY